MADFRLKEFADLDEARVEEGEGGTLVIRNAVLLGPVSKNAGQGYNRRVYTAEAMRSAVTLYEGARGYFDHATAEDEELRGGNRSVNDFAGIWKSVRFDEAETRMRGDFHVVPDAKGKRLTMIAKAFPENSFGFSHDARVAAELDESTQTLNITKIRSVNSVDVVDRPATTRNFFEHTTVRDDDVTEINKEAIEARIKAESDRDVALAESKKIHEENAALVAKLKASEDAIGISDTSSIVERLVSKVADPIAKRTRKMFTGKVATETQVQSAIDELELFATEVGGRSTPKPAARGGRRTDVTERDEDEGSADDMSNPHLAEDVFGAICGVNLVEGAKK